MDARDTLRARNRFDETLPSGLTVTIRLPRVRDCIVAGQVPLPVLTHLVEVASQNGDSPPVSMEDTAHMTRFQNEIVRRAVVAIEGQPITMTLEDVDEFSQEDYDHIVELAIRERNPTPASSPA